MNSTPHWPDLVDNPGSHDHFVQLYQELGPLAEAVARYVDTGLRRGEAAVVIATPAHRAAFLEKIDAGQAVRQGQLRLLDAEETLATFMANGMPQWKAFHEVVGGLIAELRLQYPTVRAYGEMVDVLWQRDEREAAIRLEEYWNELGRLQTFSLFCAYRMDPLDSQAYGGPLECVCKVHTHLIPARDPARFDEAVREASRKVLDQPLAQILLSLAANHRPATQMPAGQAALFWLKQNMPRTAEKVLSALRAEGSPAG
jgi:MEDS: MEthanogen/methylotroph, DcmR Sensory domain